MIVLLPKCLCFGVTYPGLWFVFLRDRHVICVEETPGTMIMENGGGGQMLGRPNENAGLRGT